MNPSTPLAANIISLAVVLMTYHHSGDPRVIVFTFILLAFTRLLMVEVFSFFHRFVPTTQPYLEKISSTPGPHQRRFTVTDKSGKPADDFGYFFFLLIIGLIAVVLMLGNQEKSWENLDEVAWWSLIYFGVYLTQDLLEKKTVMNFEETRAVNLAYNMGPVVVLFFSIFMGFILIRFASGFFPHSPWFICWPLIAIKHLSDLHFSRRRARKASASRPYSFKRG